MPNIMEIRQCFLELQLKMSGMFFVRHTVHSLAYISAAESIRVSSTTFTQSAQKVTGVGEFKQPLGLLRRSRSFKVIEFGTNRKPICDFLLVINRNLPHILHRFRDIASQRSKIATFF